MARPLNIFRKGLLLISIPVVFQLIFTGILLFRQGGAADAQKWALHTKDVIAANRDLTEKLLQCKSLVNLVGLSGEKRFEEEFKKVVKEARDVSGSLSNLVSDNPPQQQRAQEIAAKTQSFLDWLAETETAINTSRGDQAVVVDRSLTSQARFDSIYTLQSAFEKEETRLDKERLTLLQERNATMQWLLLSGAMLTLLLAVVSSYAFSQAIVRRLGVLADNARRVAANEPLTAPDRGSDEIAQVDASFHQMAEQISTANARQRALQEGLEARTQELALTNAELQQRNQDNEMFVYSVSHDLRSPLVNLQGFSRELALSTGDMRAALSGAEVPAPVRAKTEEIIKFSIDESIHFIGAAVTRMSSIIDSLLRLSRAGRVEYKTVEVDVQQVVGKVLEALRSTQNDRNARIDLQDLPPALADPAAVEQIFANLLSNSLAYLNPARPGEITVGCAPRKEVAHLLSGRLHNASDAESYSIYYVRDNGLGMSESAVKKLFLAFQRFHPTLSQGEGIGLALVKRVVDRLGARIWAESKPDVGTTFYVALLRPDAAPAVESGESVAQAMAAPIAVTPIEAHSQRA